MRLPVVVISVAALLTGGARAQIPPRVDRRGTVKICRGVRLPDGYTIVAETTSPACPRGAYVIKRDGDDAAPAQPGGSPPPPTAPRASRPRRAAGGAVAIPAPPPEPTGGAAPVLAGRPSAAPPASLSAPRAAAASSAPLEVGEGEVVRVETNLVSVPVSVFDRQGRFITDLSRQDFHIFEDGVEQEIAHFEPTDRPFTVALVLDTSASTRFRLSEIQEAAIAFARQLQPHDRVLVVTFNDEVLLLTEATSDQDKIGAVITAHARTGGSTRLYDALHLVISERLNKLRGRKAVVLFTDGVDTSSTLADSASTVREVDELDALVYPIKYDTFEELDAATAGAVTSTARSGGTPLPGSGRLPDFISSLPAVGPASPAITRAEYDFGGRYLGTLAEKTGGRLYNADDARQLSRAFSEIAEELRRQYSLGYYPKALSAGAGERRQIRVRVGRPGLAVRAREGYIFSGAR